MISGWALPRFLSGSQVSSAAEYPFHLIRIVLRLARVGTSVDSKASWARDEVVSEESDTKGYAA